MFSGESAPHTTTKTQERAQTDTHYYTKKLLGVAVSACLGWGIYETLYPNQANAVPCAITVTNTTGKRWSGRAETTNSGAALMSLHTMPAEVAQKFIDNQVIQATSRTRRTTDSRLGDILVGAGRINPSNIPKKPTRVGSQEFTMKLICSGDRSLTIDPSIYTNQDLQFETIKKTITLTRKDGTQIIGWDAVVNRASAGTSGSALEITYNNITYNLGTFEGSSPLGPVFWRFLPDGRQQLTALIDKGFIDKDSNTWIRLFSTANNR